MTNGGRANARSADQHVLSLHWRACFQSRNTGLTVRGVWNNYEGARPPYCGVVVSFGVWVGGWLWWWWWGISSAYHFQQPAPAPSATGGSHAFGPIPFS